MEEILDCLNKRAFRAAYRAFVRGAVLQLRTLITFLALGYLAGVAFYFGASSALLADMALFDSAALVRVIHIDNASGGDNEK